MNKKGFTLVELIAVVSIIAIIAVIATPNVINMIDNGKKNQFVTDAKEMISKAKYQINLEKYWDNGTFVKDASGCAVTNAKKLGFASMSDADGNSYILSECKVKACTSGNNRIYSVVTKTNSSDPSKKSRGVYNKSATEGYVMEENLLKDNATNYVVTLP